MESGLGDLIDQAGGLFVGLCAWLVIALVLTGSGLYLLRKRRAAKQQAEARAKQGPALADDPLLTSSPAAAAQAWPAIEAAPAPSQISASESAGSRTLKAIRNFFFYPEDAPQEKAPDAVVEATDAAPILAATTQSSPAAEAVPAPQPMTLSGGYAMSQSPAAMPADPTDTVEIMRILRDVADGSLVIQFGGQYYRHIGEIRAAGQERRFVAVLRELARMAKETGEPPEAAPPVTPLPVRTAAQPAPEPPAASQPQTAMPKVSTSPSPPTPPPAPPQQPPAAQPASRRSAPPARGDKPTMKPLPSLEELQADIMTPIQPPAGGVGYESSDDDEPIIGSFFDNVRKAVKTRGKSAKAVDEAPALSVGEQIERYLQRKIAEQPAFQGRDIHVKTGPSGGIIIQVDSQIFEGVGDITDPSARALVQSAVAEWESSLRQG